MIQLLPLFLFTPFMGFVLSMAIPSKKEVLLSRFSFSVAGVQLLLTLAYSIVWLYIGHPTLDSDDFVLYASHDYIFFIDLCFDKITVIYLLVGSFLTFLVTMYSRYYLHREKGYKRFFNTVLFFYLGYNLTVLSGNLETLFVGWEILGISSFLLIAFYRDRFIPVKNAIKVFSIYRVGDAGVILAMWASHHFWHENITFIKLNNYELVQTQMSNHSMIGVFMSLMILVSAAVKSAQLPFSSWLPRAMEGPTPSSAIFYGSLSVHIGVFLLLRTFPFWEHQLLVRILIALIGFCTCLLANGIARVQSSVKSQIAYASIAQIGLIFIEMALGWKDVALIHFAGNAFLRTYQLLVSPSIVSYLIKEQFFNFVPRPLTIEDYVPKWVENTFFILCLQEWHLDSITYNIYWRPLKWVGRKLNFIQMGYIWWFFLPTYLVGLFSVYHKELIKPGLGEYLPFLFSLIGLLKVFKSFAEKSNVEKAWLLVIMNHLWVALAIAFNGNFDFTDIYMYMSGVMVAGALGYICIKRLKYFENDLNLTHYQGYSYRYPVLALSFLLSCLGLSGFPITPTFIGEDLIFSHIQEDQIVLACFVTLSFIIDGLSIIRMYARLFLGPHVKSLTEMAYRSA